MQRNPYWPLNGPSFFWTTEIPSPCISLTVQVAQSASGSKFAARMASRRNFTNVPDRTRSSAGASFEWDFFDFVETSQDPDVHGATSTVTSFIRSWRRGYKLPRIGRSQAERTNCSMSLFKQQILTFEEWQRNLSQVLIV
jgi:hypothetical protein